MALSIIKQSFILRFQSSKNQEPLPPSIDTLVGDPDAVRRRYPYTFSRRWRASLSQPLSSLSRLSTRLLPADNPSASLYRLYQFFIIDWVTQFRNELEYFCTEPPHWSVSDIPDPQDPDPARYAVLAVLTRLMCLSFNRRIELGLPRDAPPIIQDFEELAQRPKVYETVPEWAERISPLPDKIQIPDAHGHLIEETDEEADEDFRKMGIIVRTPHIHFI